MGEHRVVVTGIGALTPIGNTVESFWKNAVMGSSGAQGITKFDTAKFRTKFACELKNFKANECLSPEEVLQSDLYTQYALYATHEALEDAGLRLETISPYEVGVIWGTGQGGLHTFELQMQEYYANHERGNFDPLFLKKLMMNMAPAMISMKYGIKGINYAALSACATSNTVIINACNYIRLGQAKVMITGASVAPITEATIGGFNAMRAMSTRNDCPESASRPFDQDRDGFVIGEGAGALILEDYEHARNRGAKIYAEVLGSGTSNDAYHISATDPEGYGASKAVELALKEANIRPEQVDYINAHATSTPNGDLSELKAIHRSFKNSKKCIKLSATKSMTGHLLGAAGAIEAVLSVKSIQENIIPPTINLVNIDPAKSRKMHVVAQDAIQAKVDIAMSNSIGFGGHNAILVFKRV